MSKEKFKACGRCGQRKIMTDELRRGYNAKSDNGTTICSDCKVEEIYERLGL